MTKLHRLLIRISSEPVQRLDVARFEWNVGPTYPSPVRDRLITLIEANEIGIVHDTFYAGSNDTEIWPEKPDVVFPCVTLHVVSFDAAEQHLSRLTKDTEFEEALTLVRGQENVACSEEEPMPDYKSVEVYYNVADIPDGHGHYLDFRNAAMELIENALMKANAGEWIGAESGANLETGEPEVNFGFEITDFEQAEEIIRKAVKGTSYEGIREITRFDTASLPPEERAAFGLG